MRTVAHINFLIAKKKKNKKKKNDHMHSRELRTKFPAQNLFGYNITKYKFVETTNNLSQYNGTYCIVLIVALIG
jgi:hypothetical protein